MDTTARALHDLRVLFDAAFYLERYPDVKQVGIDPVEHYYRFGADEGRRPCPLFDGAWYRAHHPDVVVAGINPLLHYIRDGGAELRNPHPHFDAAYYVDLHPEAAGNPLLFHLLHGALRGWPTEPPRLTDALFPSLLAPPPVPVDLAVDVVIPVYRGYTQTRRCIESVLADPDRPAGRILVVDDCSPDEKLAAWLDRMARRGAITLLRNARNLGFVRSVNRGVTAAKGRDVVLLNSDTEVPGGWLSRLAGAAYAGDDIATVSPFSNNATICSYPDAPGGPIPTGLALAEIDAACRAANTGHTVEMPTTVGFCMYIRRAALDGVGVFDAVTFGRGYGEEVDFCHRATALGWRHVLACDVFVYHEGEVSFGTESAHARKGQKALRARYPDHDDLVMRHQRLDPARPARFAVTAALFCGNGRPGILLVSHGLGGGVRRQIDEMIAALRGKANIFLLEPDDRGAVISVPAIAGHPVLPFDTDRVEELARFLESAAIGRVHIHHMMDFRIDVRALIHRLAVPFDVTVHDYFSICPQVNFLPFLDAQYCGEPEQRHCNACIAANPHSGAHDIDSWRRMHEWLFKEAARIICPSTDARARLARHGLVGRAAGKTAGDALVVPHEAVTTASWPMAKPTGLARTKPLRVALLGVLADRKGLATVAAVAAALEQAADTTIELHLIGHAEYALDPVLQRRLAVSGHYQEADLPGLIARIRPHVFWFPAQWPETYSYTLSAAIAAGGAIVASDLGAFPERLAGRPLHWLVPADAPARAWLAAFAAAHAALARSAQVQPPAPRPLVADFYAEAYLRPMRAVRSRVIAPKRQQSPARASVLIVPEHLDSGEISPCAYIRLLQPLYHPSLSRILDVQVADAALALRLRPDVIVTHRHAITDPAMATKLMAHCHDHGIRLIYDLDDDLLGLPAAHPDAERLNAHTPVIAELMAAADEVVVSTAALAARLGRYRRRKPRVLANGLDERLWWPPAPVDIPPAGPLRLLCMGSRTHMADLQIILPALMRLREVFRERVAIDIIGVTPFELPPGLNRVNAPYLALQTYPAFVNWISREQTWHIGLAPLVHDDFNQSKSAIKAMDYAALGLPTVASDIGVYDAAIRDGVDGVLVANTDADWFAALAGLIRDPARRQHLAHGARAAFTDRFSLAAQAAERRKLWTALLG